MGVGYIQFDQGWEQSLHWRSAIKLLDFVLPFQVVYVACDDVLARRFRTYQRQDLSRRNTSGRQSANAFFYVVGHLAVRRMRSLTSQRRVVVLSAFHTQRLTPNSMEEKGSQSGPNSKGAGVFPLLRHGDHRMYQICRSAAIGRPSCNWTAWWWRYRDERRHAVCTQPSRHRHRRKWPREGGSWHGGTRNGGESERRRRRWWELKGGDEIRGGEGGRNKSVGWEDQPPFLIIYNINLNI